MDLQHVAIIPDGNRRWSKQHGVPVLEGHKRGAKSMHNVVEYLIGQQLRCLTVWGFSTDNWKRTKDEVRDLLNLLAIWIERDSPWLDKENVRLRHIGRFSELPVFLQRTINQAVELTKDNRAMTLTLAFNYGGRTEILDAVRHLIDDKIRSENIDETLFESYLYTAGLPSVDLVIRTANEMRTSDFLPWQSTYAEYFFSPILWPDFDAKELKKALQAYSERKRRFGGD